MSEAYVVCKVLWKPKTIRIFNGYYIIDIIILLKLYNIYYKIKTFMVMLFFSRKRKFKLKKYFL